MERLRARLVALRFMLATAWPIILITAVGLVIAYQFVAPEPPRRITISTGSEAGAYHAYAQRYAAVLASKGITLEIRTSAGSFQNVERLEKGEADVAFVQGGVVARPPGDDDDPGPLRSLGSVAYEPVWVFYRGDRRVDKLYHLDGQRIAVGEDGSGIRGLALQLLAANDISADSPNLLPLAGLTAAEALQREEIDAAFIVAAQEAPVVQVMLRSPGLRVVSFSQADAYLRLFPFLSKIILPRGVVSLVRDLPPRDTVLLATTANVIVRDDLHPAVASLLLQAMTEVNGKGGFFQRAGEFPAYRDRSFALSPEAERYYKSGPPFLQRYLPFSMAVLVERLFVMILPLVMLLLPLLKFAPSIYNWRVRSKVIRCYGDLKLLESNLRQHHDPARHADYAQKLQEIENTASTLKIPLAFSDLLYTLREHINLVRDELRRLGTRDDKNENGDDKQ
ncbi:MAG TPA: TAXI family TRAP transporter solute-binding subunit [Candidatus Accumulibacter phosphatis]|nr:MAG: TRAP transporter solute receptor, TAXI family [Candidatus Accumulibacter sp. SK-11]HAY28743.1 C4-dicarboxylate ABC transporter substrate-binding protein [Accumulibacter sp.]HRL74858.1 TAXI family TRAP transporter solute-binding subunit [Candidatus Accumulibacter phosphatis]HCN68912.1 C4-dicarboxylate ABC transporter substrate-binding protein [Accumulibacter sp.]HCV12904.1 C4-dicarboxylate ABC transporter substrate-binding protein [Accumulibacter sp.]